MPSKSDPGIRISSGTHKIRRAVPRDSSSLPSGLEHYELLRELRPDPEIPSMWQHAIAHDEAYIPMRAVSSPPPFEPVRFEELLGLPGPIEVEIGTGKGRFLSEYAQLHPERPLLGIEWTRPIAMLAALKLAKRPHLRHAKILWGDAPYFLRDRMPSGSVSAFHIYFPDPWPKGKAKKRRVMQSSLLAQMRRLAIPGCRLHWGTDYTEYDEYTRELLGKTEGFELLDGAAPPTEGITTGFERKYIVEGRPIHRSVWGVKPLD
jgi:tRNA (guanine-N7-)-methyltransferase